MVEKLEKYWKGGVAYGPYCPKFNREFKERVRNFFGRICVECGAPETGRGLCVHHVNFRKDACCAEDAIPLFVPLCPSCHSKTNFNREYWDARYTALINERYGGQCYLPKRADRPVGEALATTEDIAERLMVLVGEKVLP